MKTGWALGLLCAAGVETNGDRCSAFTGADSSPARRARGRVSAGAGAGGTGTPSAPVPLSRSQVARLGGLSHSREHMRALSAKAKAVRRPGDRSRPPLAEWLATPAGRKALARRCRETGVPRESVLRVIGARGSELPGAPTTTRGGQA